MTASATRPFLPAFAVFAGFLAGAGIPIYIFAPSFLCAKLWYGIDGHRGGAVLVAPAGCGARSPIWLDI